MDGQLNFCSPFMDSKKSEGDADADASGNGTVSKDPRGIAGSFPRCQQQRQTWNHGVYCLLRTGGNDQLSMLAQGVLGIVAGNQPTKALLRRLG
jgi:hypothetical protein